MPALDIGIHLTLVGERSVLHRDAITSLVNEEGTFHTGARQFVQKYSSGQISLAEVYCELDAQIQKVLKTGILISHLDSHQHLHMLPGIRRITVRLAEKYNIAAVRYPCERFRFSMLKELRLLPRVIQLLLLDILCYFGRNMELLRTDRFFGFLHSGNLHKQNLLRILKSLPQNGTWELMCHPGLKDPETSYNHWRYHWQDELDALLDEDVAAVLHQKSISLISYRELAVNNS